MLSPDESTVYVLDVYYIAVLAINAADGALKWAYFSGAPIPPVPAVSPDGQYIYLATGLDSQSGSIAVALNASDGTVAKAVLPGDANKAPGALAASPATDAAGNVLIGFSDGQLEGFSPGLGRLLFHEVVENLPQGINGGPVIANSGTIYVTNRAGYLVGLKHGVPVPATLTPTATYTPLPTEKPNPTFTPIPLIPTDTPMAINTPSPTITPTATFTPLPTLTPVPSVPLVVHGTRLTARVNQKLTNVVVGSFTDAGPNTAASFQASIDWGDSAIPGLAGSTTIATFRGTQKQFPKNGIVTQLYLITGSHTYHKAGTFPINVTISATDGRVAYLTSIAQVSH